MRRTLEVVTKLTIGDRSFDLVAVSSGDEMGPRSLFWSWRPLLISGASADLRGYEEEGGQALRRERRDVEGDVGGGHVRLLGHSTPLLGSEVFDGAHKVKICCCCCCCCGWR